MINYIYYVEYFRSSHNSSHHLQAMMLMASSASTMASSLERSLERAATRSDGLSDKECKVRAVNDSIVARISRNVSTIGNMVVVINL
jgi:hypothetical protein